MSDVVFLISSDKLFENKENKKLPLQYCLSVGQYLGYLKISLLWEQRAGWVKTIKWLIYQLKHCSLLKID